MGPLHQTFWKLGVSTSSSHGVLCKTPLKTPHQLQGKGCVDQLVAATPGEVGGEGWLRLQRRGWGWGWFWVESGVVVFGCCHACGFCSTLLCW